MIPSITLPWITVERFGRINLIVGKNGTGKTRLLAELSESIAEHYLMGPIWMSDTATGRYRRNASWGEMRLHFLAYIASCASPRNTLFIDGIEAGLHHTLARPIWESIFDSKAEQVFVTTHSRDFVEALADAAATRNSDEACIIRLEPERRGEKALVLDGPAVRAMAEFRVEVR